MSPYSIKSKRATTVAHAFASALAPVDDYDKPVVSDAICALGLSPEDLRCVYCAKPAQTWDHLVNLVKAGELNGYGHQVGNLVPCCRDCNSQKGSKPFGEYIDNLASLSSADKSALKKKLANHLSKSTPVALSQFDGHAQKLLEEINRLKTQIIDLMGEADEKILEFRNEIKSCKKK